MAASALVALWSCGEVAVVWDSGREIVSVAIIWVGLDQSIFTLAMVKFLILFSKS